MRFEDVIAEGSLIGRWQGGQEGGGQGRLARAQVGKRIAFECVEARVCIGYADGKNTLSQSCCSLSQRRSQALFGSYKGV